MFRAYICKNEGSFRNEGSWRFVKLSSNPYPDNKEEGAPGGERCRHHPERWLAVPWRRCGEAVTRIGHAIRRISEVPEDRV